MAYTRDWATQVIGTPPGARDSDEIDDSIREFKVDLNERLADILYNVAATLWKVKIPGVAGDGSQNHLVHPVAGNVFSNVGMDVSSGRAVQPTGAGTSGTWAGPIAVPRGSTLTAVAFHVIRTTVGATVICRIIKVDENGTSTTIANSAAPVAGAAQSLSVSGLTELFSQSAVYFLEVFLQGDGATVTSAQFLWADVVIKLAGAP